MILISPVLGILSVIGVAIAFFAAGTLFQDVIVRGWRRPVDDFSRQQLLDLADRRRPGRLT